jgi:PhzF family phenazine biosynthesis protein
MSCDLFQVDSFTDRPFAGNPAAVCLLDGPAEARWMQDVARERNVSATAFLETTGDAFHLRWFTPEVELELCGHATLASAHVLAEIGRLDTASPARFHTRSGLLTAAVQGEWIEMDFPAKPVQEASPPEGLIAALGGAPGWVGKNTFDYHLVELASEEAVRSAVPDFARLRTLPGRGFILTARGKAGGPYDFISRFFAPRLGVDEDPVTGSAHCALAPYWAAKLGKDELLGYQASARGGVVRVRTAGERVKLAGRAVTVLRGRLGV